MKKETKSNDYLSMKSKLTLGIMFTMFLIGVWFFIFKPVKDQNNIKIGNIYEYKYGEDNPFEEPYVKYYRVIAKKNEYVQYVDTITKDTSSSSVRLFLIGCKRIK
jgi:hypothetical protein